MSKRFSSNVWIFVSAAYNFMHNDDVMNTRRIDSYSSRASLDQAENWAVRRQVGFKKYSDAQNQSVHLKTFVQTMYRALD